MRRSLKRLGYIDSLNRVTGQVAARSILAAVRRALAGAVLSLLLLGPVAADTQPDLYSATVIVTGRDNLAERARGIRAALDLVLTKLTVDEDIAEQARLQEIDAEGAVTQLDYLDRKAGIQISDEQGTRDRSFELTVHFDHNAINALVDRLGGKAWTGDRPEVAVAMMIDDGVATYLLTQTSERGWGHRMALADAAQALGLPVALPTQASAGAPPEALLSGVGARAQARLQGKMRVTPDGYWNTEWNLRADGVDTNFATDGVTFDDAISEALRRSARALAKY